MSEDRIDRKIAVIFATDAVGYSKSMEADELKPLRISALAEHVLPNLPQNMTAVFSTQRATRSLPISLVQ